MVSGKYTQPRHPQPLQNSNDLIQPFHARSSTSQLRPSTDNDVPFTKFKIKRALKTTKDIVPGIDKISYFMHFGDHSLCQVTDLFNAPLSGKKTIFTLF